MLTSNNMNKQIFIPDNNPENFLKDGNCNNDFWNVFNLLNLCNIKLMVHFIKASTLLLTALIYETNFFERNLKTLKAEELEEDEDVMFIGVLLLKLMMISSSNAEIVSISRWIS